MKPIPRSLLIHEATLQTESKDAWQAVTTEIVANLKRVRVEPSSQQVITADGTTKQLAALLFYDTVNSLPKAVTFVVGQQVVYSGTTYTVESVEPLFEARKLHHYEVGLSG